MAVEFRLLGDVDASVDGRAVDMGHARQRSVLAVLLVEVGRVVTIDQLIDRVWSDRPPHRARNALSGYLSRLRGRLAGVDAQIVRGPVGFSLSTDPLSIDLHRFRHLVAGARSAAGPADAAAQYEEALGLWSGEPFPTATTPWFHSLRESLLAERMAAVLDRNDAALRAGRHGDLLAELAVAVRDNPLDERLAGQLMLAQFRSGRQADALETYRRTRTELRDELGTDPGVALRQVHQQILEGGGDDDRSAVEAAPSAAVSRPPTVPPPTAPPPLTEPPPTRAGPIAPDGDLPRRATTFVGREAEFGQVASAVREGRLVTLTGVGGVGKTRLAVEVAAREAGRFPDGVRLCELAPLDDGGAVSDAVAVALRVRQRQGLSIEESVIEYLRGQELMLVLDNCEHVLDATSRLLDEIVRNCPTVTVLATSREALGVDGEWVVPLAPMPVDDAVALFADRAGAARRGSDPEGRDHDPAAVAEICRRLDGLPLAIELAAARLRVMSAAEVARRLDGGRLLSRRSRDGLPHHQSLEATIDWSYRLLTAAEKALFVRLSVFAGGFDMEAAHGVCGRPGDSEDDVVDLVGELVEKSMVSVSGGPGRSRYHVLETLRAYGRSRLREAGAEDDPGRAHASYFARLAEETARGLHGPDERVWVERALPDYENLRTAFERAVADRDGDLALRVVTSVSELLHLRVGYEVAGWAQRALELVDDGHPLVPAAVGVAARGAWNRGEFAAARTLAARAGGRRPARGTGRIAYPGDVLADVALYEGDAEAALRHYAGEVEQARHDDDPIRLVWTLYYVAVCQAVLRAPDDGLAAARDAVLTAEATANPTALSMARYAMGLVLKKSDPERALTLFDEAAELAASVQNFWWEGIALMEAAATLAVHARVPDLAVAADALRRVLDHWDRVGDRTQQWLNLRYITRFLVRLRADDDAVALHAALVAARKPSPFDRGGLGSLAEALGPERFDAALRRGSECTGAALVGLARSGLRVQPDPPAPVGGDAAADRPAVRDEATVGGRTAPASAPAPFVGRTHEMLTLQTLLAGADAGRGTLAFVGGEAGIGKTRLAEEFAAYAQSRGRPVLWGRAREADGAPPFWPWVQVLRQCAETGRAAARPASQEIDRILADLETAASQAGGRSSLHDELADPRSARFRLFDRVVGALREQTADGAAVVILDDLQWADPPSLALLRFLTPTLSGTRVLVVATYRTVDVDPGHPLAGILGDSAGEPRSRHMTLSGLDAGDVGRYVDAVAGTPLPEGLARSLHAETEGNPFFVTELVRLLAAQETLAEPGVRRTGLPPTVRLTIRRRLDRLTPACRAMLETAAVLGRDYSVPILERAAGEPPGAFDDLLVEASEAVVVTPVPDDAARFRFVHALVRETVYDSLTTSSRCRWHGRAAEALAQVHGPDGGRHRFELVHHRLRALPDGDPATAVDGACAVAASTARMLAHEEAVRLYELCLECVDRYLPGDTVRRCRVLIGLGRARRRADRPDAAAPLREAAGLATSLDDPALLGGAALALGGTWPVMGMVDRDLLDLLERAAARAEPALRSRLLARTAIELYFSGDPDRRAAVSEEALRLAVESGDAVAEAQSLVARHWALYGPDHLDERMRIATRMVALGEETGEDELLLQGKHWRIVDLLDAGDVQGADLEIAAYADLADRLADPFARWQARLRRTLRALLDGRFDDAEVLSREAYEMGRRQDPRTAAGYHLTQRFWLCRERGRLADVEAEIGEFVRANPAIPSVWALLAVVYADTGRPEQARRILERWSADAYAALPRDYTWLSMIALFAEVCADVGDEAIAATTLEVLRPYVDRAALVGRPSFALGSVARHLGILAATVGRYDEAEGYFESALSANTRMGATPFIAHTQAAFAAMLVARGEPGDLDRAATLRADAAATADELSMRRLASRLFSPHLVG